MRCLGNNDVVRDATVEQMSQAVFSVSPLGSLGDYISRPTKLNSVSAGMNRSASSQYSVSWGVILASVGMSRS
jgi:hypothetical protein